MQPVARETWVAYERRLERARVPVPQRPDDHKWIRFYLDFCLKELRESYRWLRLIQRVPLLRPRLVDPLVEETDELVRIFVRSIQTARQRKR
jgi:hypothetical protein